MDARDDEGNTPLANSIDESEHDCAEFLFEAGAKISIVCEAVEIPDWMEEIVEKRRHVKRGLLSFLGVLSKRFVVVGGGAHWREIAKGFGWSFEKLCLENEV